jgi:FkbH-like protein
MRLIDALATLNAARGRSDQRTFDLLCGFQPLHLATLLAAHLQTAEAGASVQVREGLYGDVPGNVERAAAEPGEGAALVLEWDDLDPRLGIRHAGSWSHEVLPDILENVERTLARILASLTDLARVEPVALCLPTLPLPPIALTPTWQASEFDLELLAASVTFGSHAARIAGVRVLSGRRLEKLSPLSQRRSPKAELATGFPYTLAHADVLAGELARLLTPPTPKKGVITDLDETVWAGILGELGVDGVSWDLDHGAGLHGLYQGMLSALAQSGVLVSVVSKNDPVLVEAAFERTDIRLSPKDVFPVIASWGPKSEAVAEVLRAWNVGADSVVFVDDSPLEVAEVQQRFPTMECIQFPTGDPEGVLELIAALRDRFGKEHVFADDALRLSSLRGRAQLHAAVDGDGKTDIEAFLGSLEGNVTVDCSRSPSPRALELVNKTNQFNLNGERYSESEWRSFLEDPDAFVLAVHYGDRFGQLGTIAVVTGRVADGEVQVERWVMSCRAFARRIEHATLRLLFDELDASTVVLAFGPTERNGPFREFLSELVEVPEEPALVHVTRELFEGACRPTYHAVLRAAERAHG